jgi:hypothetical protein
MLLVRVQTDKSRRNSKAKTVDAHEYTLSTMVEKPIRICPGQDYRLMYMSFWSLIYFWKDGRL